MKDFHINFDYALMKTMLETYNDALFMFFFQIHTVKHFLARAVCLIALPVAIYIAIFYVHLKVLHLGGEEDEFFSSAFQVSLKGNQFHDDAGPRGNNF